MSITGFDYLFLGHKLWPIESTIKLTPQGSAIGFFDDVVSDPRPNLKKLLASKKFPVIRVQLHYSEAHTLIDVNQLNKRAALYEQNALAHPEVKFYLSHTTEYKDPNAAAVKLRVETIKKVAPHCIPVNNPMPGGATVPGVLLETHDTVHKQKAPYLVSSDGYSVTWKMDVEAYKKRFANAEVNFFWASLFNMAEEGAYIPPMERTAIPSDEYLKAIVRLTQPIGVAPTPTFKGKIIPIKKPYLMKAFSEDKVGVDVRANKPMLISSSQAPMLSIVDMNGKQVAQWKYFGNYTPGLWRHYSGTGSNLYGYQIGNEALKSSGSEWVWAYDPTTKIYWGPFHPQFRAGYFDV